MEKKIEDYINLYSGCEAIMSTDHWHKPCGDKNVIIVGLAIWGDNTRGCFYYDKDDVSISGNSDCKYFKLLLRPLSDMTETESDHIEYELGYASGYLTDSLKNERLYQMRIGDTFEITCYLLSRGFDLFGLIESGIALDKTKIK